MDYLDVVAKLAAAEGAAAAQKVFERFPNLDARERNAVVGRSLSQAYRDHLGNYIRAEADAAFARAIDGVCQELLGAASGRSASAVPDEHDKSFGLGPRQAAEFLHRRRTGR